MNSGRIRRWIYFWDLLWVAVALYLTPAPRLSLHWYLPSVGAELAWPALLLSGAVWTALYWMFMLDGFGEGFEPASAFSKVLVGSSILSLCVAALAFFLNQRLSILYLSSFEAILVAGLFLARLGSSYILRSRFMDRYRRRVVIVGFGQVAHELAAQIGEHPELLCEVIGFLSPDSAASDVSARPSPRMILGELVDFLQTSRVTDVIICSNETGMSALAKRFRNANIQVSLVPRAYELYINRPKLMTLDGLPVISLPENRPSTLAAVFKPIIDYSVASVAILLTSPLWIVVAVYLRLKGGAVFRREIRCGRKGIPFQMLRFNLDRESPAHCATERLMQNLSIAELPQLFNVLRGEMSVVGPRPEPPSRVEHYTEWQRARLSVKPGITGLAQVHGLREHHPSDRKALFDAQYLMRWSPLSDIFLILQTAWTLLQRSGASPKVSQSKAAPGMLEREDVCS